MGKPPGVNNDWFKQVWSVCYFLSWQITAPLQSELQSMWVKVGQLSLQGPHPFSFAASSPFTHPFYVTPTLLPTSPLLPYVPKVGSQQHLCDRMLS